MNNYLSRLVERHIDPNMPVLQPRIPSRFEDISPAQADVSHEEQQVDALPTEQRSRVDRSAETTPRPVVSPHENGRAIVPTLSPVGSNPSSVALPSLDHTAPSIETIHSHHHYREPPIAEAHTRPALNDSHSNSPEVIREVVPLIPVDKLDSAVNSRDEFQRKEYYEPGKESTPLIRQKSMHDLAPMLAPQTATEHRRTEPTIRPTPTIVAESLPRDMNQSNTVHVSIGRIEIRSPAPKPEPKKTAQASTQARIMTLDEYVRQRTGGVR